MKYLICGIFVMFLAGVWLSPVHAVRPHGEDLPEIFLMLNDENFNMTFDGKTLSVTPKKNAGLHYSCNVAGKFPQISYSGDYAVQGPYHPNDSGIIADIVRNLGRNTVSLAYIEQMTVDAQKAGVDPDFDDRFASKYVKTFDTQSANMPADLKQIDEVVRKDVDKICNDFVKYAIPRLNKPPAY